ncbi:MAG: hypothetical protein AAF531_28335, partial [Actinomycetota bacterium]
MSSWLPLLFENWGATDEERAAPLPGDDRLVDPYVSATRSITVTGSPDRVLAWLVQMGTGRAGWYSYDLIDNYGRRSAEHIEPSWAVTAVGETVPVGPISFEVTHLEPAGAEVDDRRADGSTSLVLAMPEGRSLGHRIGFTLAYRESSTDGGVTSRLVSRVRID